VAVLMLLKNKRKPLKSILSRYRGTSQEAPPESVAVSYTGARKAHDDERHRI